MKTGGFFIITIILSLSIQAQTVVTKETGTIRPTSSSLYKAGKELVVSISIDITRDLSSNESMVLVPIVCDTLEHRLKLPPIISTAGNNILFSYGRQVKKKSLLKHYKGKTGISRRCIICNPFHSSNG